MAHTVKVVETKSRPTKKNGYMMIMRGIRTKEAAQAWGAKYGFSLVYWIRAKEKVYGISSIADDAQEIKLKSEQTLNELEKLA